MTDGVFKMSDPWCGLCHGPCRWEGQKSGHPLSWNDYVGLCDHKGAYEQLVDGLPGWYCPTCMMRFERAADEFQRDPNGWVRFRDRWPTEQEQGIDGIIETYSDHGGMRSFTAVCELEDFKYNVNKNLWWRIPTPRPVDSL